MSSELDAISLTTYNASTVTASSNMFRKQMSTQQEADAPNLPPGAVSLDRRIASIKTKRFVRKVDELHKLTTTSEQDKDLPDLLAPKVEKLYKMFTDQQQPWDPFQIMPNDWRWQRIFGQFAVLILLGTFLCFVDSDNGTALETLAGILLATVVAASIWSGGVSVVLLGSSVWHIAKKIYKRYRMRTNVTMRGLGTIAQFIARRRGRNGTPSRTGALSKRRRSQKKVREGEETEGP